MPLPDPILACAGRWRGTNVLQDPFSGSPAASDSTAEVTPLLDGRFLRIDYTWAYDGAPQQGSFLIGHESKAGVATLHWIDSWHNSESVMALTGRLSDDGTVTVLGSFPVPDGPDWGWRIAVTFTPGSGLRVVMHNVEPDGEESLAVEADYTPEAAA